MRPDLQPHTVGQFHDDRCRVRRRGRHGFRQHDRRCKRNRRLSCQGPLLPPLVDQACRNLELARNSRHHRTRRKRRRQNSPPLIVAPTTPTLRSRQQRYLGHAALLCVLIRTPYERRLTTTSSRRKAVLGGGIRRWCGRANTNTRSPCGQRVFCWTGSYGNFGCGERI